MSGKKLALIVVVPFLALAGIGYWLTQAEAPAPVPDKAGPAAQPAPSPKSLFGTNDRAAPAPANVAEIAPSAATRPAAPAAEPSRTPVTDGLTRALLDARPKPIAPPAEPPQPTGTVDKEDVRAAIEAVKPLVRQCFDDAAERNPGPQRVTLTFTIQGQGLTGYLKDGEVAESSIQDPFLNACFLDAVADAKFPPPHGGGIVKISYPFRYSPAEDAGP